MSKQIPSHIPQEFGVQLTQGNIESHLAHINHSREAYLRDHQEDVAFIRRTVQQAADIQAKSHRIR